MEKQNNAAVEQALARLPLRLPAPDASRAPATEDEKFMDELKLYRVTLIQVIRLKSRRQIDVTIMANDKICAILGACHCSGYPSATQVT